MPECTCKESWTIFRCAQCKTEYPRKDLIINSLNDEICPKCKHYTGGELRRLPCPAHSEVR